MLEIILTTSIAFIVSFMAIPVVITVAKQKKLFDIPDERKLHKKTISSLGGIGIFIGFFLASILTIHSAENGHFQYYFAAALMIFFLGLKDDLVPLSAFKKFLGQVLAAAVIIHLGDVKISSMYGIFGFYELPTAFSLALSYLTIILVINAFNLIDGVDGLSSSLGILSMSVLGSYFYNVGMLPYALLSFALVGSLVAFLIFNHHPAKIFMGDSGSMLIGLMSSILVIQFMKVAGMPNAIIPIESVVTIGVSILFLPLLDTIRVFSIRMLNGRSPFSPDRNHIHHLLLDCGLRAPMVTLVNVLMNALFIFLAYSLKDLGSTVSILALSGIGLLFITTILVVKNRREKKVYISKSKDGATEMQTSSTVIKLTQEAAAAKN